MFLFHFHEHVLLFFEKKNDFDRFQCSVFIHLYKVHRLEGRGSGKENDQE
jgi:hypothetical protein